MPDIPADESGGVRLVMRVADATVATPGAVVDACGRCGRPVFVDRVETPDPPGTVLPLVCVPCALADPQMRDGVLGTRLAIARLTHALRTGGGR